jgi:hypothetical protein
VCVTGLPAGCRVIKSCVSRMGLENPDVEGDIPVDENVRSLCALSQVAASP